jgi:two-component system LytT family sensor kinase
MQFKKVLKVLLPHISIWTAYFFYENGALLIVDPKSVSLLSSFLFFLLNAIVFYVHTYWVSPYTNPKKNLAKNLIYTLLLFGFYIERCYYMTNFMHEHGIQVGFSTTPFKTFFVVRTFRFIYIISISYLFWLARYKVRNDKTAHIAERDKIKQLERLAQAEKETLATELKYLRAQINPHFLFNTLSFIYTQVIQYSEETAKSILLLSNIISSALNPIEKDDKITLADEIKHIENLIEIHQLRFSKKLHFDYQIPCDKQIAEWKVPPLLLITFVENVFKYGDLMDSQRPCKLHLDIEEDKTLIFFLSNKKNNKKSSYTDHGIGIKNAVQRLEMTYGEGNYTLSVDEDGLNFNVYLTINQKKL